MSSRINGSTKWIGLFGGLVTLILALFIGVRALGRIEEKVDNADKLGARVIELEKQSAADTLYHDTVEKRLERMENKLDRVLEKVSRKDR